MAVAFSSKTFQEFQLSKWLGQFCEDGFFRIAVIGDRKSLSGPFMSSWLGQNCKLECFRFGESVMATKESLDGIVYADGVLVFATLIPALSDAEGYKDEEYFRAARRFMKCCHLVLFCIDMSKTRLHGSVLRTIQELEPNWNRTIFVLMFTHALPGLVRHCNNPRFPKGQYFNMKLAEWTRELKAILQHIGVEQEVVAKTNVCPTTDKAGDLLPNGEPWLPPLSLTVMGLLSPEKKASFLEEHASIMATATVTEQLPTLSPTASTLAELMATTHVGTTTKVRSSSERGLQASAATPVLSEHQLRSIRAALSKLRKDCPVFGILVIGRTGVGKSTLINNLLGKEVARVGHTLQSETPDVDQHEVTVEGVQVVVYDTPGLGDVKGEEEERRHLKGMEKALAQKKIHLVVYCLQMNNTMMTSSIVGAIHKYHQIGVDWQRSVIALTFADALYVPEREQALPNFRMSHFFEERLAYWRSELEKELVDIVGVKSVAVAEQTDPVSIGVVEQSRNCSCLQKLICCQRGQTREIELDAIVAESDVMNIYPTSLLPSDELPNGKPWYVPLWLRIVEILSPAAVVRLLDIHRNNISDEQAPPPSKHFKVQLQLTREDKNRVANAIAVTVESTGMDSSEVLSLSESCIGDLLKLFAPEQAGQSGSEPEQATSPQNQTQSVKESILSQNVYGECESKKSGINRVGAERNFDKHSACRC